LDALANSSARFSSAANLYIASQPLGFSASATTNQSFGNSNPTSTSADSAAQAYPAMTQPGGMFGSIFLFNLCFKTGL
jgi:hypothetical protein